VYWPLLFLIELITQKFRIYSYVHQICALCTDGGQNEIEQVEFKESLLSLSSRSSIFSLPVNSLKVKINRSIYSASHIVSKSNLVFHPENGTYIEDIN
jgi:hypothetical protein